MPSPCMGVPLWPQRVGEGEPWLTGHQLKEGWPFSVACKTACTWAACHRRVQKALCGSPPPPSNVCFHHGGTIGGLLSMSVKTQQPYPPPMGLWVAKTLSVHGMHCFKVTLAHRLFTSVTFVAATTPMAAIDNGHGCAAKATMHAWHA